MAGLKHAGIIDSDKKFLIQTLDRASGERAAAKSYLEDQFSHNIFALKGYINTINDVSRLGRPLSWQKFEALLRKLPGSENFVFIEHTVRPFRALMYRKPEGLITISAYGRIPNIPEFSTMEVIRKAVPDFGVNHLNRADFPELEWKGDSSIGLDNYRNQTGYVTKDGSLKPGWTYRDQLWGENPDDPASRGWRTVLCKGLQLHMLGQIKFASPEAIDRIFGGADSPQWAKHTGKQNIISPF